MQFFQPLCWHLLVTSIQPAWIGIRWLRDPAYFAKQSPVWLALTVATWIYIVMVWAVPSLTTPLRHLPSPPIGKFPFGHGYMFRRQPPTDAVLDAIMATPNDGLIAFWTIFYIRPRIIPVTPEAIMDVLNTHNYDWEKPIPAKKLLYRVLGDGLINVEGNQHKAMRRSVAPAFSGRQIRDMVPLFYQKGLDFGETMAADAAKSKNSVVEIMGQMSRVTLDVIGAAGIGKDFNTIHNDEDELARLYATITDTNRGPLLLFVLMNTVFPPWLVRQMHGTVYQRVARAQLKLREHIRQLLAEKKQAMAEKTVQQKDIIATIMRSGDFSDDYLADQLLTFLAAGHDTTASALTWTSWLLAERPEMQARLRKECQEHLAGVPADQVDADLIDRMPYLTAVCNETLRMYPTVPITSRHAVVNTKVGKQMVPKGTEVLISPWAINRLPALWGPDATEYNPDRWLDGPSAANGGAKSTYALITFLHGPRSCIGQGFARMEMKCLLAALITRFRFEVADPSAKVEVGGFITIKPKGGLYLKLHDLKSTT